MKWYEKLKPVKCGKVYGRIIGSPSGCAEINGEKSMFFMATPGGTVVSSGRAYIERIESEEDFNKLIEFEQEAHCRKGENIYGGPGVLERVNKKY